MIFIIGFTGAGKTTIGRNLAKHLNWPFKDLDQEIEIAHAATIKALFEKEGENRFRKLETEVLNKLITGTAQNSVIAMGGGTPCFNENMKLLLQNGLVIYVQAAMEDIINNLNTQELSKRPLIPKSKREIKSWLQKTMAYREPFYLQAHLKVPSNVAKSPELLTNAIFLFTKDHSLERT